ncbi:hypothetical protein [Devosia sp.]|uniref:hypothetical protein n=1 Tax=Devosia sp. TaxID=1871048 RepID=UPI0035B40AD5
MRLRTWPHAGRSAAVIDLGWLQLTGGLGWWVWGLAHIYFLIGVKNRISVAISWLWIYRTGHRSARLITWGEAGGVTGKAKAGHA